MLFHVELVLLCHLIFETWGVRERVCLAGADRDRQRERDGAGCCPVEGLRRYSRLSPSSSASTSWKAERHLLRQDHRNITIASRDGEKEGDFKETEGIKVYTKEDLRSLRL